MTLHIVVKGRGIPVLVLHGLLSDHSQVYPLLPALKGCRAYFPDLIGCGKSPGHTSIDIIGENVKELRKLCRKHKIETIISYSVSGMMALALRLPNTIFISSFCTSPVTYGALHVIQGRESDAAVALIKYRRYIHRFLEKVDYTDVPSMQYASVDAALLYMVASLSDHKEQARSMRRVLVIHGTSDKLIDSKLGEELAKESNADTLFVSADHTSVLKHKTVHAVIARFVHVVQRARDP